MFKNNFWELIEAGFTALEFWGLVGTILAISLSVISIGVAVAGFILGTRLKEILLSIVILIMAVALIWVTGSIIIGTGYNALS